VILRTTAVVVCALAIAYSGPRWLRVAQREHYLVDSVSRFALRWWTRVPVNLAVLAIAVAGLLLSSRWPAGALATAAAVAVGPIGLSVRGRTSPLAWTRRLRTLAAVWVGLEAIAVAGGIAAGQGPLAAAAAALAAPALVDLACAITAPLEHRLAGTHVARATARLRRVAPKVVAITGSFGKTSTKGYVAHLLGTGRAVVASPASFNNRAGLARAVNENLAEGTEIFVAEMGTYRRGEIAELCSWIRPDVAVITAIGPVHLERFGSEDRVLEAKAEILDGVASAVLLVDDERLAALADSSARRGTRVWRVSARDTGADVSVVEEDDGLRVTARGDEIAHGVAGDARPGNVAAAVAVALELGVPAGEVGDRLRSLPVAPHRLEQSAATGGVIVLDDTYNSNPAGGLAALATLRRLGANATRRVVVTPGMVELGPLQAKENATFSGRVAGVATDLVVVGRINRGALLRGARQVAAGRESPNIVVVRTRQQATEWVRTHLGPGDVVLYENDLPDHYP
jgi:UDP-N-acetylmuramoyl-tripeptide--D-alanyl-D-alanine ligase